MKATLYSRSFFYKIQLLFFFLSSFCVLGQGEANNWYFGSYAGLTFNTIPPTPLTNGVLSTSEGCATISDVNGNLLFYTDGIRVYDRNHILMPNGNGLLGHPSSAQSGIIIPKPGSLTNYIIVTVPEHGPNGIRYSEVDMSLNSGFGDVLVSNKNTLLYAPSSEKVTAIRHSNGVYFWIVGHGNGGSRDYVSFLLDCDGVDPTQIISSVGISGGENWGYMVASPNGNKIAIASSGSGVEVADFNTSTGAVSNVVHLGSLNYAGGTGGNYGIAFSANNNILYATSIHSWALTQWDLTAADIPASRLLIGYTNGSAASRPNYRGGALQLAPDGKIYVAEVGLSSLGVINNPNTLGLGCDFVPSQIGLSGRTCLLGLPPFVTSFFDESKITITHECVGDSIHFSLAGALLLDSVKWNFGEPSSIHNESNLLSPKHKYSAPGVFDVYAIRYINCIIDTVSLEITINDYDRQTKNIDLCQDGVYILPGGATISSPGVYIDTIPSLLAPFCESIITTIVDVPILQLNTNNDTLVCIGENVQLFSSGGIEYNWDPNPTLSATDIPNPIATPTSTTTYYVRSKMRLGNNLIRNGDFEQGNNYFSSQYVSQTGTILQGGYFVGTSVDNSWFAGCGDNTTGSGNMLIADAACGSNGVPAGVDLWCQTIEVEPGQDYAFSAFLANMNNSTSTARIGFFVNGVSIGDVQTSSNIPCDWNEFNSTWNSGSNTIIDVCVKELTWVCSGADFAVDDISFYKLCEVLDSVHVVVSDPVATIVDSTTVLCFGGNTGNFPSSKSPNNC